MISKEPIIFIYDQSFDGLLTAIFESYRLKANVLDIVAEDQYQENLFNPGMFIQTDINKAQRVLNGVGERTSNAGQKLLRRVFLSEQAGMERLILEGIQKMMTHRENILSNFADPTILRLHEISRQMGREVHRMHAFVRFQQTKDGLYAALIEPDFNVLPLIGKHFEDRYPAQDWLIYDTRRRYGILYEMEKGKTRFITLADSHHERFDSALLTGLETDYQRLWKSYFKAVDIPERRNMKLHLQHVPRRYWRYLVEKW